LKDLPGLKSRLRKALGYTSDGAFYYDLQYLKDSGFTKEEGSCIVITEDGESEFESYSTLFLGGVMTLVIGAALIYYYWAIRMALLTEEGIPIIGVILVAVSFFLLFKARRNVPKLPSEAKKLLKEVNRQ
jgi:hypothetical protein